MPVLLLAQPASPYWASGLILKLPAETPHSRSDYMVFEVQQLKWPETANPWEKSQGGVQVHCCAFVAVCQHLNITCVSVMSANHVIKLSFCDDRIRTQVSPSHWGQHRPLACPGSYLPSIHTSLASTILGSLLAAHVEASSVCVSFSRRSGPHPFLALAYFLCNSCSKVLP